MKKLLFTAIFLLLLCGCGTEDAAVVFSLAAEQEESCKAQIAEILTPEGWAYNPDAISFAQTTLPQKESPLYAELDTFTSDGGLKASAYAGKLLVQASVPLSHINGSNVGTAYFYFTEEKSELVCQYYTYKDKNYGIKSKNPFELNSVLTAYENTDIRGSFVQAKVKPAFSSVYAAHNGIIASVKEDNTVFYYDSEKGYRPCAKADFTGRGLVPLDITLNDEFGTILFGEPVKVQQSEDENEVSDSFSEPPAKSVCLAITDSRGNLTGAEISTTVSSFSSVAQEGNSLYLARDKSIEEYVYENGSLTKTKAYMLEHYAVCIRAVDIDGNGTTEFIISDGTNIYIYEKAATFNLIWRSNSYLSSIIGNIYVGDLNGDGVKELYITDSTGVAARYILTPQGFRINSGGIMTGVSDSYVIADFNNDGKDDYMIVYSGSDQKTMYLAQ